MIKKSVVCNVIIIFYSGLNNYGHFYDYYSVTSYKPRKNSYRIKSENETLKFCLVFWQKVKRDGEDTMSSGKLFQTFGAATGNTLLLTVCKQTEGTIRWSVRAE